MIWIVLVEGLEAMFCCIYYMCWVCLDVLTMYVYMHQLPGCAKKGDCAHVTSSNECVRTNGKTKNYLSQFSVRVLHLVKPLHAEILHSILNFSNLQTRIYFSRSRIVKLKIYGNPKHFFNNYFQRFSLKISCNWKKNYFSQFHIWFLTLTTVVHLTVNWHSK